MAFVSPAVHTRRRELENPSDRIRPGVAHDRRRTIAAFNRSRPRVTYDISIRPHRTGKTASDRGAVEFALAQFSALQQVSPGQFVHRAPNGRAIMSLRLEESDPVRAIRINIPGVLLRAEGGQALRLCFQIADRLGWGILDEQLGAYIERDAIPDILTRYQYAGETVTEFLNRRTAGRAGFTDIFRFHLWPQTRKAMLICIGLASVIAGSLILRLEISVNAFPWMAVATFVLVISTKAGVQTVREMRRRGETARNDPAT